MLPLILALISCAPSTLVVSYDQPGCTDYDFDDPASEAIETQQDELALHVQHVNVIDSCDAVFAPELETEGDVLLVHEAWESSDSDADCTTCWSPRVTIKDPQPGDYQIQWFVDDSGVPWNTVTAAVD